MKLRSDNHVSVNASKSISNASILPKASYSSSAGKDESKNRNTHFSLFFLFLFLFSTIKFPPSFFSW